MRNLKDFYCRLDEKVEHLEKTGYIFTHGYGANRIGNRDYIRLDNILEMMQIEVTRMNSTLKEHQDLLTNWEKDKTHPEYYKKEDERLSKIEDNLYKYYYENVYAILTSEEVDNIQKKINYNFMSDDFIKEVVNYLENEKLERVA